MRFVVITFGVFSAVVATAVISYIAMATMIGPWIAPTLVLVGGFFLRRLARQRTAQQHHQDVALMQSIGSVGGAVGMAVGFSLPTLYFLDQNLFTQFLVSPVYFSSVLGIICLAAGGFGIWLARAFSEKLLTQPTLKFPVSSLIYNAITSQSQGKDAKNLFVGFAATGLFCMIRDGFLWLGALLPRTLYLVPSLLGKEAAIALYLGPTFWAIGFMVGSSIALPLLVGVLARYLVLYPINVHSAYLPFSLFPALNTMDFTMAFCSGLVISEFVLGLSKWPQLIKEKTKSLLSALRSPGSWPLDLLRNNPGSVAVQPKGGVLTTLFSASILELLAVVALSFGVLTYLKFSWGAQLFIMIAVVATTYQISFLGAKVGIVPFGRFATFVMVPTMLFFSVDYLQITLLCVFVNVCSGVASDLLFDYKIGQLCHIEMDRVHRYQWIGLLATSVCIGLFFWLMFNYFQIGSAELCAQRGQTRALMIQSTNFNYWVLAIGFFFGLLLKKLNVSPSMTLGGILMPNSISIGLIAGGLFSRLFKEPKNQHPFWSGVFACETLWIILSMFTVFR